MRDFFTKHVGETVIIDQVYPGSDMVMPRIEVYQRGKKQKVYRSSLFVALLTPLLWVFNRGGTHIVFKLRDFLSVLDWGFRSSHAYDIFIGFEAVNALAAVLLRRLGRVKRVIYYVSDYSPNRYSVKWFNRLYLWLDQQAAMRADVIWDVSPAMQPARVQAGLNPQKSAPVLIVPNALYPAQIKQVSDSQIVPYSLVFMGTLGVENGPDLAIQALPFIRRRFPKATLHLVGGGEDMKRLRSLAKTLHLGDAVVFHGFIADREKVSRTIRKFAIALAPYLFIPGSARLYGDATKIRAYLAAGLPTITTSVPPLGAVVAKAGAAVIVNDTASDVAQAVIQLLANKRRWQTMRKAAIQFAKQNTWNREYEKAFISMEKLKGW